MKETKKDKKEKFNKRKDEESNEFFDDDPDDINITNFIQKELGIRLDVIIVIIISILLMNEMINQSHIGGFSEEEKVQIQQIISNYELNIISEDCINIISDLGIHINQYNGSYVISRRGYSLIYQSSEDQNPTQDEPTIFYSIKEIIKVGGGYILLGLCLGGLISNYIKAKESDNKMID